MKKLMISGACMMIAQTQVCVCAAEMMRIGYLNLASIKAVHPASKAAEQVSVNAENQLQNELKAANEELGNVQDKGGSQAEVKDLALQLKTRIDAKQQALIQIIQAQRENAIKEISTAASQVGQELGLDLVVDGGAVYAGGRGIVDNGVDVTVPIAKKLRIQSEETPQRTAKPYPVTIAYFDESKVEAAVQPTATANNSSNSEKHTKLLSDTAKQIAKERGIDIVVATIGVFRGGNKILASGKDLTNEMIKRVTNSGSTSQAFSNRSSATQQAATLNNEAVSAQKSGNLALARQKYQEALAIDPSYELARQNLAMLPDPDSSAEANKSVADLLKEYEAMATRKSDADLFTQIAVLQLAQGNSSATRQNADKALSLNPQEETKQLAISALCLAMLKDGESKSASTVLSRAANECDTKIWTYRLLSYLGGTLSEAQLLLGQSAEQKCVSNTIIGFKKLATGQAASAGSNFANASVGFAQAKPVISTWLMAARELDRKFKGQ